MPCISNGSCLVDCSRKCLYLFTRIVKCVSYNEQLCSDSNLLSRRQQVQIAELGSVFCLHGLVKQRIAKQLQKLTHKKIRKSQHNKQWVKPFVKQNCYNFAINASVSKSPLRALSIDDFCLWQWTKTRLTWNFGTILRFVLKLPEFSQTRWDNCYNWIGFSILYPIIPKLILGPKCLG